MNEANVFVESYLAKKSQEPAIIIDPLAYGENRMEILDDKFRLVRQKIPSSIFFQTRTHKEQQTCLNVQRTLYATGSVDKLVHVNDLKTGSLKYRLAGSTASILDVSISPNEQHVSGSCYDQAGRLWSLKSGRLDVILLFNLGNSNWPYGKSKCWKIYNVWKIYNIRLCR